MIVGVHRLADETLRLHEYSPGFDPERFAAHERFFVEDVRRLTRVVVETEPCAFNRTDHASILRMISWIRSQRGFTGDTRSAQPGPAIHSSEEGVNSIVASTSNKEL